MSEEIERRVELSLFYEKFLGTLASPGHASGLFRAVQKIVGKVLRVASQIPEELRGTPLHFELSTRKELQAAIDVVVQTYAATEQTRPVDPHGRVEDAISANWGDGTKGALFAYSYLEMDDDGHFEKAKGTAIDAWWTGDNQLVGDLVEAGLLTPEDAEWRRWQAPAPTPLRMPRDEIVARPVTAENADFAIMTSDERDAQHESNLKVLRSTFARYATMTDKEIAAGLEAKTSKPKAL